MTYSSYYNRKFNQRIHSILERHKKKGIEFHKFYELVELMAREYKSPNLVSQRVGSVEEVIKAKLITIIGNENKISKGKKTDTINAAMDMLYIMPKVCRQVEDHLRL